MKSRVTVLSLGLLLAILAPAASPGQETARYRGRGEALIVNNDLPKAKRDALAEAFKNTVQKAVGVYIKARSKVENFEMTYSKILSESEGFVKNYKILKEKTEDGIYSVEIEAEVSAEKLNDAFSQRLSKFVEKNLFSTFTVMASAMISGNRFYNLTSSIMIMINDPTIEIDSIQIKLPRAGWTKPRITKSGLANLIWMTESIEPKNLVTSRYIEEVIYFLEHRDRGVEIRFKNPGTGKEEVRSLTLEKLTLTTTLGAKTISILNKEIKDVNERELADAVTAFKKAIVVLEYEKKLIGMSGTLALTMGTARSGGANYGQISISFSIPASGIDISAIDAQSIELRMPVTGWTKPELRQSEYSIEVALNATGTDPRTMKYLADIAHFMGKDDFEIEVKYRDRAKQTMVHKLALISNISIAINEDGKKKYEVQGLTFDRIDPGVKDSIRSYLNRLQQ